METAALVESLGGRAVPVKCDVSKPEDIEAAVEKTLETFGRIDVMINNARHEGPSMWARYEDVEPDEIVEAVGCNFLGPMLFCRRVIPPMIKQGGGMIINVTSGVLHSVRAKPPGDGATGLIYPTTKTGLDALTYGLTPELQPYNISVLGLAPGRILIERPTGAGPDYFGTNLATRQTVHIPAVMVDHLVTVDDPMQYTGQVIYAVNFVKEHGLMAADDMSMPFQQDEIYDPYSEPYWQRLVASKRG